MAGLAGDGSAHRIQSRAEPGRALDGNPVVGRAGPVQLPVGQPPDQGPADEITESGFDKLPKHRYNDALRLNTEGWRTQAENIREYVEKKAT